MTSRNDVLVGMVVAWPNIDNDDLGIHLPNGRGVIVTILEGDQMLVEMSPRVDDPEPPFFHVLPIETGGLHFFRSLADEERWYDWICNSDADAEPLDHLATWKRPARAN